MSLLASVSDNYPALHGASFMLLVVFVVRQWFDCEDGWQVLIGVALTVWFVLDGAAFPSAIFGGITTLATATRFPFITEPKRKVSR